LILQEAGGYFCSLEKDNFFSGSVWQRSVIAALDENVFKAWKAWVRANQ